MTTIQEVTEFIRTSSPEDVASITFALDVRQKALAKETFRSLKVGDKVRLKDGRPKYLMGAVGTVREKRQTKVTIDLDEPHGRFHKGIVCPTSLLELVDA